MSVNYSDFLSHKIAGHIHNLLFGNPCFSPFFLLFQFCCPHNAYEQINTPTPQCVCIPFGSTIKFKRIYTDAALLSNFFFFFVGGCQWLFNSITPERTDEMYNPGGNVRLRYWRSGIRQFLCRFGLFDMPICFRPN